MLIEALLEVSQRFFSHKHSSRMNALLSSEEITNKAVCVFILVFDKFDHRRSNSFIEIVISAAEYSLSLYDSLFVLFKVF